MSQSNHESKNSESALENLDAIVVNEVGIEDLPGSQAPAVKRKQGGKPSNWLEIIEVLAVAGSLGGTVVTIITQQLAFATVPLSLSVALNLLNRKHLLAAEAQKQQNAIAQLHSEVKNESHTSNLLFEEVHEECNTLRQEFTAENQELKKSTQNLYQSQNKILKMVNSLRELELWTGLIRVNNNSGDAYYNRGLVYQRLGDKEAAIVDYTKAISLNLHDPNVYQNRGLLRSAVGDKQGAVEDLRQAAKLFFEQGDMTNYQQAKEQSKKIHDPKEEEEGNNSSLDVSVDSLFSELES